ncbi:MAG: CNNM domain-containing protein [Haloferacaceae archaeon]
MVSSGLAGVVALLALLSLSAFFSSSEMAVFSLPTTWIDARAAEGDERAAALAGMREDSHRLLVTVLVGNNLVNVAISSLVTLAVSEFVSGGTAVVIATLLATSVVLVCGEIVPKSYGLANAERLALAVVRPLRIVGVVLYPLVLAFDGITRAMAAGVGGTPAIERQYESE